MRMMIKINVGLDLFDVWITVEFFFNFFNFFQFLNLASIGTREGREGGRGRQNSWLCVLVCPSLKQNNESIGRQ